MITAVTSITTMIEGGSEMKLRDFVNLYDNWNGILIVNDDNLKPIVKDKVEVALSYRSVYEKEVVAFGFYDNELCVRVR